MTTEFNWGARSIGNFKDVHPDLVKVANLALELSEIDITITDGSRTMEQQRYNVAIGASQTLKSNHIIQSDGYAYAIDFVPYYDGSAQPKAPWEMYVKIANAFKAAAKQLNIEIVWGGDWHGFVDGCHIELNRKFYTV